MSEAGPSARAFGLETLRLDLPPVVGALSRRLHEAGVPMIHVIWMRTSPVNFPFLNSEIMIFRRRAIPTCGNRRK
jgi:hypothetical protein